ncbi:MAG TPA: alanine--glyoxylate aminotransferase family protein [Candidatus Eremiobacteraceae bacterium]|nr:alanine--glyoxylate aminotransferase family protein [Candidatus Eremiobacteraceae bacterium]
MRGEHACVVCMEATLVHELLLLPGPVAVAPDVLQAAALPMQNHRGPRMRALLARITERCQEILQTKERVFILGSSGTGALEAAIVNLFSPGDLLLSLSVGAFGDRIAAIARTYGAQVESLAEEWGCGNDPARLARRLAEDTRGAVKGILVTHNETSTGVANDLAAIARARADHPALLVVDSVSGAGAEDLRMDEWCLDAVATASQKALAAPPGCAVLALSRRAWDSVGNAKMPRFYLDLTKAQRAADEGSTPWTPPVPILTALERATDNYLREGRQAAFSRHARFAAAVRSGCIALGLSLFARPAWYSSTVTAVCVPQGIEAKALLAKLRERFGVVLGGGQQKLDGKVFRIGNMGAIGERDLLGAIGALELTLDDMGYRAALGQGVAATARALEPASSATLRAAG